MFAPVISLPPMCMFSDNGPIDQPELGKTKFIGFNYDCDEVGLGYSNHYSLFSWVYNLIYWYLLSCLIYLIWKKSIYFYKNH